MRSIHDRGFDPSDRTVAGHWEADLIVGLNHRSAIATLVERQTRYVRLVHLPAQDSNAVKTALVRTLLTMPAHLRLSLTWDQGTELARHLEITAETDTKVFFADAASPWQRGTNENTNGLLRQYFPKSTNLAVHTPSDLARVAEELNSRPRMDPRRLSSRRALQGTASLHRKPTVAMTAGNQGASWPSFRPSSTGVVARR